MFNYDIAIVGGGPAGLSAAYTAGKAGIKLFFLNVISQLGNM